MSQMLAAQLGGAALDVALADKPQQTRQLAQMGVLQLSFGIDEQRGGQAAGTVVQSQLVLLIQQDMLQFYIQPLQKVVHSDSVFPQIGKQKLHLWIIMLGLFQHRHFTHAGRAPGGPDIEYDRLAGIVTQVDRLAGRQQQRHVGQSLSIALQLRQRDGGAGPDQAAGEQRNTQ